MKGGALIRLFPGGGEGAGRGKRVAELGVVRQDDLEGHDQPWRSCVLGTVMTQWHE